MVLIADTIGQRDDLGRRVGGVAPGTGELQIASAGVSRLEIDKDGGTLPYDTGDIRDRWQNSKYFCGLDRLKTVSTGF